MSNLPDTLVLAPHQEGRYSVKLGYLAAKNLEIGYKSFRAFKFCWNPVVLPKAGNFSWLALKKRILTGEKLSKLNIVHNIKCVLCMEVEENVDHLFVQCKLAHQCWIFILQKLNYSMPLPNTLWDMFQDWPTPSNQTFYSCIWKCIPTIVIWAIWWERNKMIF